MNRMTLNSLTKTVSSVLPRRWTRSGAWVALALTCSILISCRQPAAPERIPVQQMLTGLTMGTGYSIKLMTTARMPELTEVSRKVQAELESVNAQMSTYVDSSELSRFNQQQSDTWFAVSHDTAKTVQLAQEFAEITHGAFDSTVSPLVQLWGFGGAKPPQVLPDESAIQSILQRVGYQRLDVQLAPPALRKDHPQLHVDLSAIAKGHGVDRIAELLDELGCENYFVEIGGEVRTRGYRPDGKKWRIGIERPVELGPELQREIEAVLELSGQCLATSGDYRSVHRIAGRRISHTIDPRTGFPVKDQIASASAVAGTCAEADAIATSMMALGVEDGLELAEKQDWAVWLIIRKNARADETEFDTVASSRFHELFPKFATRGAREDSQ